MREMKLESAQGVKNRGVKIVVNLKFLQYCKYVAGKPNLMVGFVNIIFSLKTYFISSIYFNEYQRAQNQADKL